MDFFTIGIILGIVICIMGVIQKGDSYFIFGTIPGDFICIFGAIILLLVWALQTFYAPEDPVVTDNCTPITILKES